MSLTQIVNAEYRGDLSKSFAQRNPMSAYFLDQVFFDSILFKEDPWINALEYFRTVKADALVISAALMRIDRPEYKNNELTHFQMSPEELRKQVREGYAPYDPVTENMSKEFELLEKRFGEARKILPDTKLFYMWSKDDGFSSNRIAHYLSVQYQQSLRDAMSEASENARQLKKEIKRREKKDKPTKKLEKKYERISEKVDELDREGQVFFRPRKESAAHQVFVNKAYEMVVKNYQNVCSKTGVKFLNNDSIIEINGNKLIIKYSGRVSDDPTRSRPEQLSQSLAEKVNEYTRLGLMAYVEGHQGLLWAGRFDSAPSEKEINTGLQGTWNLDESFYPKSVYALLLPLFHDQKEVIKIMRGEYPERFAGRSPTGTRKHHTVKMHENGAVSGITGLLVDEEGRVGKEIISYNRLSHNVKLPESYSNIEIQSDTHLGSANTGVELVHGATVRRIENFDSKKSFRNKPVEYVALLSAGDDIEGNSSGWKGAGAEFKRKNPIQVLNETLSSGQLFPKSKKDSLKLLDYILSLAREGPHENMGDLMSWVNDYYFPEIEKLANTSRLKTIFAAVGSNHSFGTLRAVGINPYALLTQSINSAGVEDRAVFDSRDARSNMVYISQFGMTVDNRPLFGPLNLVIHHDPQNIGGHSLFQWNIAVAQNYNTDLVVSGHYHQSGIAAKRRDDKPNRMIMGINAPCNQNVTSTDIFKGGRIRNKGTVSVYIPTGSSDAEHIFLWDNESGYLAKKSEEYILKKLA